MALRLTCIHLLRLHPKIYEYMVNNREKKKPISATQVIHLGELTPKIEQAYIESKSFQQLNK